MIIPVYNVAGTLEKCVESIIYGKKCDVEIILIDDCSEDNSWNICCSLAARFSNVYSYKNRQNSGVSYTRNQGLKRAKGKYILFVDSDDWVSRNYIKYLIETHKKHQDSLVICGLYFLNNVAGYRRKYLWNDEDCFEIILERQHFFDLQERFLLQQLWNKVFLREIIEQNHICFDESQSMGEDFQFVLDYMEAAEIQSCVVVNRPLYYYVRANNYSLMSKFGLIGHDNEYKRLEQLKRICKILPDRIEQQYQIAIEKTKYNYVYQVCRSSINSRTEKLNFIENIMHDKKAEQHYKKQQWLIAKEKIVYFVGKCKELAFRIIGKLKRVRRNKIIKKAYKNLKTTGFTIISQNCIGGVIYHDMQMQFLSPTINLFFKEPDFVRFVNNLKYYINLEMEMSWEEEYPVGRLDDVMVYFMHYSTCSEAKNAWEKRKKRINWEKIIILATDMEGFDDSVWEEWCKITYPKILFTATKREKENEIFYRKYKKYGHVQDLIPKREFYKNGILIENINYLE